MDKLELEIAMLRHGIRIPALAEKIGMNKATFYQKLKTGKFERSEIIKIRDELGLSDEDMLRIFFADRCCENATETEAKCDDT